MEHEGTITHGTERLILRPLFDNDIALMERWLYTPHVAQWYEHPDHWLNELRERRGEFSFLTHFIAEFEGVPIGSNCTLEANGFLFQGDAYGTAFCSQDEGAVDANVRSIIL